MLHAPSPSRATCRTDARRFVRCVARRPALALALAALAIAPEARAQNADLLQTGAKSRYVHRISLYDADGAAINPRDPNPPPYSTARTCGKCHPYDAISHGWHFNAMLPDAPHGRPGEPWLWVDEATGTVLPLSYRTGDTTGVHQPAAVGLTQWDMLARFGRHMPGGGFGVPTVGQASLPASGAVSAVGQASPPASGEEPLPHGQGSDQSSESSPEPSLRWAISGPLEIDCLICHSIDGRYDPEERARQIEQQNYRWAPTAAAGLARVRGAAAKLPDDYDPLLGPSPDYPDQQPPQVQYDLSRFDADDRVYFDLTRHPLAERCYYCHTVTPVGPAAAPAWSHAGDVHLAAGLQCTDCHQNGLDHAITRGYANERTTASQPAFAAVSCEGCHMGTTVADPAAPTDQSAADPSRAVPSPVRTDPTLRLGGRLGSPRPAHRGLPPVHFDKLSCTACHSGPWPEMHTQPVQTSLAHALGLASKTREDHDPPAISEPVFFPRRNIRLHPHRILWPAWWGLKVGDTVKPLPIAWLPSRPPARSGAAALAESADGGSPDANARHALADGQLPPLVKALRQRIAKEKSEGELVYIADGKLRTFDAEGRAAAPITHAAASAYLWPVGHDVRPAAQSLGARGCTDCHAADAPLLAGWVTPVAAMTAAAPAVAAATGDGDPQFRQSAFTNLNPPLNAVWNRMFAYRKDFKLFAGLTLLLTGGLLLHYGQRGLAWLAGGSPALLDAGAGTPGSAARARIPSRTDSPGHDTAPPSRLAALADRLATALGLAALAVLAFTGFAAWWSDRAIAGWSLLAHMSASGTMLAVMLWLAFRSAARHADPSTPLLARTFFWLALATAWLTAATALAPMFPWFDTDDQHRLLALHGWWAAAFTFTTALFIANRVSITVSAGEEDAI